MDETRAPETEDPAATAGLPPEAAGVSRRYANYVLGLLFLVTTFNVADRYIFSALLQPIKEAFDLTDTQMGFLVGPAFAVSHALAAFPVARWADRGVRRSIVAGGLFVWSALTAASGLARGFVGLTLARVGVSIGEAAGSSPCHSMIADYFPPERRATALAIFSMGGIIGMGLGLTGGGWINDAWGWRYAFFMLGIPGMALALVMRLTVREPERGATDLVKVEKTDESAWAVTRYLFGTSSYLLMVLAAAFHAFAGYGVGGWYPAFLIRVHGMTPGEAGTALMIVGPFMSAAGAYLAGRMSDTLGMRDARWYMAIPAVSSLVALPFSASFLLGSTELVEVGGISFPFALFYAAPAAFLGGFWNGPTIAMVLALAKPHQRAMAAALLTTTYNAIGLGLGPLAVGFMSEWLTPDYGVDALRYALLLVLATHLIGAVLNALAMRPLRADLRERGIG